MPKGQWTPPDAGDAPQEVKDILRRVYTKFRDENPEESEAVKEKGAKIAWGAVKNAGWEKNKDGKWSKTQKKDMKESLPGSFDDIRQKINEVIRSHPLFPEKIDGISQYPYIIDINDNIVIVSYNNKKYAVSYSKVDDIIITGKVKEVEETYIIKESITNIRESRSCDVLDYISLKEAQINEDGSVVKVVLIESGTNRDKKRHYPDKTIRESAAGFAGLKMYINHPTAKEESERPERDLRDWVATIKESSYEDGKAIGIVHVHDTWLKERLKDPVAREAIGLSINTGGKVAIGKINGEDYQIVEKIVFKRRNGPVSVDWVTEAGARGRVLQLMESQRKGKTMELENVSLVELKEARKDLVESIAKDAVAEIQTKLNVSDVALKEANTKIKELETKIKESVTADALRKQNSEIETILKEAKIPEASKKRIASGFKTVVENIKESVAAAVKSELEYINSLSLTGKINISGTESTVSLKESLQYMLDERIGVAVKKEEKK